MCESGTSQLCDELATATMHHPAACDDVCVTNSIIVVRDPNPEEISGVGVAGDLRSASVEGNYNLSCASSSGISSIRSSDNEAIRRKMCAGGRASERARNS